MAVIKIVPFPGPKGDPGAGSEGLTLPTSIKDTDGDDLIVFEKGGTGVARIDAVQDDLALRSARDIILYPGDDGAGNVYINWGDATIAPDATNQVATIADIQAATTADFVFTDVDANNSSITITGDKEMTIESGADSDLNVRAGDQLWLTAGNDVILQADDTVQLRSTDSTEILTNFVDMGNAEHRWEFGPQGYLTLPAGGQIINTPNDSSDGGLLSTLMLSPDSTNETNQVIIIDPTGPNHIHLRAGGNIDESTAELILGGERNKVAVSDSNKSVLITTAATIENTYVNVNEVNNADLIVPDTSDILIGDNIVMFGISYPVTYFSPDPDNTGFSIVRATGATFVAGDSYTFVRDESYEHPWQFASNGYLYGPAMGGLFVSGLINGESDLWIYSNDNVVLNSDDGGQFLGSVAPENQIAKISYSREQYTTPATITGAITDMGKLLYANCGDGDMTYLIPDNGDVAFPIGSEIKFATGGDARWFINREDVEGPTDLIADGGNGYTAINDSYPYIIPIYSTATLMKVDTNRWILSGMRLTD